MINEYLNVFPGTIGFSSYMWNYDITYKIAKEITKINSDTKIIFGGPNFPLELKQSLKY